MAAAKLKLTIEQGATFRKMLTWKAGDPLAPVNLTGCAARMQIRATLPSPVVLHELTTDNGGITLGGTAGTIALYISDEQTALMAWTTGVWDIEIITAAGDVTRLLYGPVTVSPEVTR